MGFPIGGYGCIVTRLCDGRVPLHIMEMESMKRNEAGREVSLSGYGLIFTKGVAKWVGIASWHEHGVVKWEFFKELLAWEW